MLAGANWAGAGFASNRDKAPVVECIIGYLVGPYILPNLLRAPVGERVEFGEGVVFASEDLVVLNDGDLRAGTGALIFALSRYPGVNIEQLLAKRGNFTDATALLMIVFIEAKKPLFLDEFANRIAFWVNHINVEVVVISNLLNELVGFRMESAGVEAKHFNIGINLMSHVNQDDVFSTAERNGEVAKLFNGKA